MTGGLGACGRELCCATFLNRFDSVSIKMAKAQDLPLNPAKISGVCNRLLCCLTYEYETYNVMKKGMPRAGRSVLLEGKTYHVTRQLPLMGRVAVVGGDGEERLLTEEEWRRRAGGPAARSQGSGAQGRRSGRRPGDGSSEENDPRKEI